MKIKPSDVIKRFKSFQQLEKIKGKLDMEIWLELYKSQIKNPENKKYLERVGYVFMIASVESRSKDIFIKLIDEFGLDYSKLSKDITISLTGLKKIEDNNLSRGNLIASTINFQNINHIVKNFEILLGFKSLKKEMSKYFFGNYTRNVNHREDVIDKLFTNTYKSGEKRNIIIHQNNLEINHENAFVEILSLLDFIILLSEVSAQTVKHEETIPKILTYLYSESLLE